MRTPTLRETRFILAESLTNARTVRRYFAGEKIRGVSRERIEEALVRLGWHDLLQPPPVVVVVPRATGDVAA